MFELAGHLEQEILAPVRSDELHPGHALSVGKRLVRDLGNARLLTYRGDGHGVITDLNQCVAAALVPYLEDGTLPPPGAACEQDLDPFAARAAATPNMRSLRWRAR